MDLVQRWSGLCSHFKTSCALTFKPTSLPENWAGLCLRGRHDFTSAGSLLIDTAQDKSWGFNGFLDFIIYFWQQICLKLPFN